MTLKKLYHIFIFFTLCNLSSCVQSFDFEGDTKNSFLVVSGTFSTANEPHYVYLSRSFTFDNRTGRPEEAAVVTLHDDIGNSEQLLEVYAGAYKLRGTKIKGEIGRSYHLEIDLLDGDTYQSKPQEILAPIIADSAHYRFASPSRFTDAGIEVAQKELQILVDVQLPSNSYVRWEVDEYYDFTEFPCSPLSPPKTCYIQVNNFEQLIATAGNEEANPLPLQDIFIAPKKLDPRSREFTSLHYFNVHQHTISREAHEFWSRSKAITQQEGDIFDTPPAVIPSNIINLDRPEELVRGFFEVSSVSTVRTAITSAEMAEEFFIQVYCNFPTSECCNCLSFENSSREKPEWF